jgi:hypothetical protein
MGTYCILTSLPTLLDTTKAGLYLQIRRQKTKWSSGHSVYANNERRPWPKPFDVVSLTQGNSGTSYPDQGRGDHQPHTTTPTHVPARGL